MTQKWINLHAIYVVYPSGMFGGVLDLSGAHRGANWLFSQWGTLFELWRKPNLSTLLQGQMHYGHHPGTTLFGLFFTKFYGFG